MSAVFGSEGRTVMAILAIYRSSTREAESLCAA